MLAIKEFIDFITIGIQIGRYMISMGIIRLILLKKNLCPEHWKALTTTIAQL